MSDHRSNVTNALMAVLLLRTLGGVRGLFYQHPLDKGISFIFMILYGLSLWFVSKDDNRGSKLVVVAVGLGIPLRILSIKMEPRNIVMESLGFIYDAIFFYLAHRNNNEIMASKETNEILIDESSDPFMD